MNNQRGFTLVELMIVVVVLSIIVAIAVPSYRNFVLRSHRTDATATLLKMRTAQEKFFLQRDRYATTAELTAAPQPGPGLGFTPATEHGYYQLGGVAADPLAAVGTPSFVLSVTAVGGQLQDTDCRTFTITDRGVRGATDAGGATSQAIIDSCWR